MAIELLNLSSPNDGLGDTLRDGGVKINNNFTFLDTTKQNADSDLTAIAGLAGTSGLLRKTAANTWALDTNSYLTTAGTAANSQLLDGLDSSQFLRSDTAATKSNGALNFNDNIELRFGNGLDFRFLHDGTSNLMRLYAGDLLIQDATTTRITIGRATGNIDFSGTITGNGSGLTNINAATLDSLDSTQFLRSDTTAIKTAGSLILNDNVVLRLGTGQDFNMFHDGAANIINLTAGDLLVQDNGVSRYTFARSTGIFSCSALNTGQGNNELYAMNQNVRTTDSPSFSALTASNAVTAGSFVTGNWTIDQVGNDLVFNYNGAEKLRILSTGGATETV